MNLLKFIYLTFIELTKQAWLLPQSVATGIKRWRQQVAADEMEAERLDRIRHPSKYLGK